MQPQDASGGGFDWWHAASGMAGAIIGAASTLLTWIIRAARMEPTIRAEFEKELNALEKQVDDKVELLVGQFQESFNGMRRQIDDHRLHTEQSFLRKDDFRDFRDEYREDKNRIFEKLDKLLNRQ